MIVVNLDPYITQSGIIQIPLEMLGLKEDQPIYYTDLLNNRKYIWNGREQVCRIEPHQIPAHIFQIYSKVKKNKTLIILCENNER